MPATNTTAEDWEKVLYEVRMFNFVIGELNNLPQNASDGERNKLVELLLLHARIIWQFLSNQGNYKSAGQRDDMHAKDFVSGWDRRPGSISQYLGQNRERLNKSLAHLSYSKSRYTDQNDKEWDVSAITSELRTAWSDFLIAKGDSSSAPRISPYTGVRSMTTSSPMVSITVSATKK